MSLLRLYRISEAGVMNQPTKEPRKKKSPFKHANGGAMGQADDDDRAEVGDTGRDKSGRAISHYLPDDDDDFEDDLGPELDYDDPSPEERNDEPEPVRPAKPFKEPEKEKEVPFARQSAKPSPALQGGKTAGSVKVDPRTLGALEQALENVRTGDDNLQDWIDDLLSEIGRAIRSGGELTLPKFEAPSDDDGDDQEDEDY